MIRRRWDTDRGLSERIVNDVVREVKYGPRRPKIGGNGKPIIPKLYPDPHARGTSSVARRCFYRCLGCQREVPAVQDVRTMLHRLKCSGCGHSGFSYHEVPVA